MLFGENQDFNFFSKKLAITKEKALNPLRFKAFGAARQIRTADLILTKDALYRLSYSSISVPEGTMQTADAVVLKWRRGRDLNPRPPA